MSGLINNLSSACILGGSNNPKIDLKQTKTRDNFTHEHGAFIHFLAGHGVETEKIIKRVLATFPTVCEEIDGCGDGSSRVRTISGKAHMWTSMHTPVKASAEDVKVFAWGPGLIQEFC